MTRDHSGRASAAEKVSGMHNTAGRKTREVAAYDATTHRAFTSLIHIYPLSHMGVQLFTQRTGCFARCKWKNNSKYSSPYNLP
jgi:hypothetical protein